jgi:hypothetical protein
VERERGLVCLVHQEDLQAKGKLDYQQLQVDFGRIFVGNMVGCFEQSLFLFCVMQYYQKGYCQRSQQLVLVEDNH